MSEEFDFDRWYAETKAALDALEARLRELFEEIGCTGFGEVLDGECQPRE